MTLCSYYVFCVHDSVINIEEMNMYVRLERLTST